MKLCFFACIFSAEEEENAVLILWEQDSGTGY